MSYANFFRATMVVLVLVEFFLIWRGANIVVIVAVPLVVGLIVILASRLVPGWGAEVTALRGTARGERQDRLRLAIILGLIAVIVLSAEAALLGYGPMRS